MLSNMYLQGPQRQSMGSKLLRRMLVWGRSLKFWDGVV